jgi:O-antigen/teichoic acid export membrane protein
LNKGFSRNLAYNVAGSLLPVVSAIVTVPLYLQAIGPARYGIVSISWILLGYFGFLDFGLSRASANALGRLGQASAAERAPVLMTAFYLNLGLGALGGLILFLSGDFLLRHAFSIPPGLRQETLAAFAWMVPMLPLGMVLGVASGALESRERFLLSNTMNAMGTVLGQVIPLLCVYAFGHTLAVVIPALLLARLLVVVAIIGLVVTLEWPVWPAHFHMHWARRLFGYGAWVSVSSLITPVLDTFDQILIGRMLGPVAIAHYAVPMNLALRSQVLATALARTLFPRLSREEASAGRLLATHATVSLIYGFGAVCGPAVILAGPFLNAWVGYQFGHLARPVAEVLMLGAWVNGVAFMPYNQLQAQGRPDLTAKVHAVEIVPFVLGLWWLIHIAGLPGAAWAWTLRVAADCVALLWLAKCLHGSMLRALPAAVLMALAFFIADFVDPQPLVALVLAASLCVAFLAVGVGVEPVLRGALRFAAGRVLGWSGGRFAATGAG